MCWSLERWGEVEGLRQVRRDAERAERDELERLLDPLRLAVAGGSERQDGREPVLAGRASSGTGTGGA